MKDSEALKMLTARVEALEKQTKSFHPDWNPPPIQIPPVAEVFCRPMMAKAVKPSLAQTLVAFIWSLR